MTTGRNDIAVEGECSECGGDLIIIPEHGPTVQHEDAELEADHQPVLDTTPSLR